MKKILTIGLISLFMLFGGGVVLSDTTSDKMSELVMEYELNNPGKEVRFIRVEVNEDGGHTFTFELYGKNQDEYQIYPVSEVGLYKLMNKYGNDIILELDKRITDLQNQCLGEDK